MTYTDWSLEEWYVELSLTFLHNIDIYDSAAGLDLAKNAERSMNRDY